MQNSRKKITTILFDLDGVIRIYLDEDTHSIEKKYGLPIGLIDQVAFSDDLVRRVTTGLLRRIEWVYIVGGQIGNLTAALEWENRPVYVDKEIIKIISKLREDGIQICLVTNGTDNLLSELQKLGIDGEFSQIFNSYDLGIAKPSPDVYMLIVNRCKLNPENIAYVDDNINNVTEAKNLGINSFHYNNIHDLKKWLFSVCLLKK